MKNVILLTTLLAAFGCARFRGTVSKTKEGVETVQITTWTLWDSKNELTKVKGLQTDKSQSVGVGTVNQETSATNVVRSLELINAILSKGAMVP